MKRALVIALALVAGARIAHADEPTHDYVVQPGDTCLGIAARELGDGSRYAAIHRLNPGLGKPPHNLVPGSILKLPAAARQPSDATLTAARGAVKVRKPARADWDPSQLGMDLFRAWRVGARARSSAEVTFRDTSRLFMRENTIVIIYGATGSRASLTTDAELESGALESRLAAMSSRRVVVHTPSAEAGLGNGNALVVVDASAATVIANHGGSPAAVRAVDKTRKPRGAPVQVAAGMGSKVKSGQLPSPPRALPPAPSWQSAATRFVDLAAAGATVTAQWSPVAVAARYHLAIHAADGRDILATDVPAPASALELHRLRPGRYAATIATIDADGFESAPSVELGFDVIAVAVIPPGASQPLTAPAAPGTTQSAVDTHAATTPPGATTPAAPVAVDNRNGTAATTPPGAIRPGTKQPTAPIAVDTRNGAVPTTQPGATPSAVAALDEPPPDPTAPPPPLILARGSRIVAADGVTCTAGTAAPTAELTLDDPAIRALTCRGRDGHALPPVPLTVAAVQLCPGACGATAAPIVVARGKPTSIHLAIHSDAALGPDLVAHGAQLDILSTTRTSDGVDLVVQPTATATTPGRIALVTAAGAELATTDLAIESVPATATAPAPHRRRPGPVELGLYAGYWIVPGQPALGAPVDPRRALSDGPATGLRAALWLDDGVGLELEAVLARTGQADTSATARLAGWRAQLFGGLERGPVGLRFLLGAGTNTLFSRSPGTSDDTRGVIGLGAAATLRLAGAWLIRLDARDDFVLTLSNEATQIPAAYLGVSRAFMP